MKMSDQSIEKHPLPAFLPRNAKILMLGSFPPPKQRWKMDFYYPNFQNDMWRIMGTIFFEDKSYFIDVKNNLFYEEKIKEFLEKQGIAIYDAAETIRRLQNNASDKYLHIIQRTDINHILTQLPVCKHIVTTGEKATQLVLEYYQQSNTKVPLNAQIELNVGDGKSLHLHRIPSSSRAYPLALSQKAEMYKNCFLKIFNTKT